MTSQNWVKSNWDVIANFSLIFRNSEILFLFNNTKIPELHNSET